MEGMMLVTIGTKTIDTDHIAWIEWNSTRTVYVATADGHDLDRREYPCVVVCYVNSTGFDELTGRDAAILATLYKDWATDLNKRTPDAAFTDKYPELPSGATDIPF